MQIFSLTVDPRTAVGALVIGLPMSFLLFKLFFGDRRGFDQDVHNNSRIPLLDKDWDYVESGWSHLKLQIWMALSAGTIILAYHQLPEWFPKFFTN